MSDQPPPPKAKPGSLRDRIAAFEKSTPSNAPPPLAPRPKPAQASWKPRQATPPDSPAADESSSTQPPKKLGGGMSASDAKESIGKGGSLKERMAALQGKGAFGAPPPPVAPKPAVEKPKWKPPPPVAPPSPDEKSTGESKPEEESQSVAKPPSAPAKSPEEETNAASVEQESAPVEAQPDTQEEKEADPEEEERERRAALAARMARLGGARVGIGAPVFGGPAYKKPKPKPEAKDEGAVPPVVSPKEDAPPSVESRDTAPRSESQSLRSPPAEQQPTPDPLKSDEGSKKDYFEGQRKTSDASSLLSPESAPSTSASPRTPSSMPVPAAPRRAAPPRRKAKSPAPPPVEERHAESPSVATEPTNNKEPDAVEGPVATETEHAPPSVSISEEPSITEPLVDDERPQPSVTEETPLVVPVIEETPIPTAKIDDGVQETIEAIPSMHFTIDEPAQLTSPPAHSPGGEPSEHAAEEEEDDAARRKRIAERLAKSGGTNPFALPPQRKPTLPVESSEDVPSPISTPQPTSESPKSQKRTSIRKASTGSTSDVSPSLPERRSSQMSARSVKKPSSDSITSRDILAHDEHDNDLKSPPAHADISEEPEHTRSLEEADVTERADSSTEDLEHGTSEQEANHDDEDSIHVHEDTVSIPQEIVPPPLPPTTTRPSDADTIVPTNDDVESNIATPTRAVPPPPPPAIPEDFVDDEEEEEEEEEAAPVPPPRRSMPPPSRAVPQPLDVEEGKEVTVVEAAPELPRRLPPRPVLEDDGNTSDAPLPHPNRSAPPAPPTQSVEPDRASDDGEDAIPRPIPASRQPPPNNADEAELDDEYTEQADTEDPEEILPTPPRRTQSPLQPQVQDEPLHVPPPPKASSTFPSIPRRRGSEQTEQPAQSSSPLAYNPTVSTPADAVSDNANDGQRSAEILDEEDGDPIDPSFYSPPRHRTSVVPPISTSSTAPEPDPEPAEDEEQLRRRTIAERMAKLGGIKFGAAPISAPRPPPPPKRQDPEEGEQEAETEEKPELTEEEEERARKERIAAKLANMGGMRIGMQPYGMLPNRPPPTRAPPPPMLESPSPVDPPTPSAAPPRIPQKAPPAAPSYDPDSEHESLATSDEGVRVEAEESEMEEVNHEDAQEEEEAPPPLPTREGRRASSQQSPSSPSRRPPVPAAIPPRRASTQTTASRKSDDYPPVPTPSTSQKLPPSQSEYVMVEEPDDTEEIAPPPPPRAGRPPPPRSAPGPNSSMGPSESISSQWEMPSIPSVDFGGSADLSLSWTDDAASSTSTDPQPPAPPTKRESQAQPKPAPDQNLNADDLVAVWGRVGVQVCEVATTLHEKSKKALIGDGTYHGFIEATLKEVPNAAPISGDNYGYLVYMQSGSSVQKRASEILPGDIIWMHDAKLKGHKGLQTYHQSVGAEEPLVGVVNEFEAKKFKIRVFQANQHVGQQTVESVSYRLEDLKSGTVKVFRVLEA